MWDWIRDFDGEQARYNKRDSKKPQHWSFVLFLFGTMFFVLRRTNLWELFKHIVPLLNPKNNTPAYATDFYLFSIWGVWFVLGIGSFAPTYPIAFSIASGWCILQTIQTLVWHNIWRTTCLEQADHRRVTLDPIRTMTTGLSSLAAVTWWFAIIYHANAEAFFGSKCGLPIVTKFWDCLYFSFVTAATVGYGDIVPVAGSWARTIVMLQIAASFILVVVILAHAISSLEKLPSPEKFDSDQNSSSSSQT